MTNKDRAFYGGLVTALAVVALYGQETIYREIIDTLGGDICELVTYAKENDEYEFSGLNQYGYR